MKRLYIFTLFIIALYCNATLIDTHVNPLEWSMDIRFWAVIIFCIGSWIIGSVEFNK